MKAVLFDLDNTLLIKRPTIADKWREDLCKAGYSVTKNESERAFALCEMWVGEQICRENETGVRLSDKEFLSNLMNRCIEVLGIDSSAEDIIVNGWIGRYEKTYEIAKGTHRLLDYLLSRDVLIGIVSNNTSEIRKVLDELNLTQYFSVIVLSQEVDLYKPDPHILLYALNKLNVEPGDAIYVGDHPFDVICAQNASIKSAWIPVNKYMELPENTKAPAFRINSLDDLIAECGL